MGNERQGSVLYKTKIKPQYAEKIKTFFWNDADQEEFTAIMTMDNMTLLWCEETNLIVDIFNNKIETFKVIPDGSFIIEVEAKTKDYADRFALHGTYFVTGYVSMGEGKPTLLELKESLTGTRKTALPSRLKIVEVKEI